MTMETQQITVDREEARVLFRKYREHQHYQQPIDWEIQRTYQLIAQGRLVIKALHSIHAAGVGAEGYPRLAISRADAPVCFLNYRTDGGVSFTSDPYAPNSHRKKRIDLPPGSFPPPPEPRRYRGRGDLRTMVPLIPIHLRPKRGLQNYHILFEAEWRWVPPIDPMLLRRIGQADLWVVCAAWDLTEVERAVLAGRLNG